MEKLAAFIITALSFALCIISIRQFSIEGMAHSGVYLFLSIVTAISTGLYLITAIDLLNKKD
jgi:hypothetical protein